MTNTLKNINWLTTISNIENVAEDVTAEWPLQTEKLNETKSNKRNILKSNHHKQSNSKPKSKKNNYDNLILPDLTNQYDLYHKATSVNYIKEKYDVYSNWLAKNNRKLSDLNSKEKNTSDQLSWYEFQKSVYVNEHDCFRFLKNITNSQQAVSNVKEPKKYHSTMGVYKEIEPEESTVRRSVSTDLKIPRKGKESLKKISKLINVKSAFYSNKPKDTKSEERDQSLVANETQNIANRSNLKHIAKVVHFVSRVEQVVVEKRGKEEKEPVVLTTRKILPPIKVRCSDDFYAVLNDINNEEDSK